MSVCPIDEELTKILKTVNKGVSHQSDKANLLIIIQTCFTPEYASSTDGILFNDENEFSYPFKNVWMLFGYYSPKEARRSLYYNCEE